MKNRAAALGAVALLSAAAVVLPAGTADAATACTSAGFKKTGPNGVSHTAYYCQNRADTDVWSAPWMVESPVGVLYTTTNWFICKSDSKNNEMNDGPHPYRWEYTVADNGQRGWVIDTDIASETNPLANC